MADCCGTHCALARDDRHLRPAHYGRCTEVGLEFRAGRRVSMFALVVYAPFVLCLPALLVVGLVFVVVPGGSSSC